MTVDYIRYDILTQDALRSVVHTVRADVAAKGLPGEHHFFISINTRAEGVGLSPRLKAQYPKEMTVVLQHQFWDMVITDDRFEVGLSLKACPERRLLPFRAVRELHAASVLFGLQFAVAVEGDDSADVAPSGVEAARPPARHDHSAPPAPLPLAANPAPAAAKPDSEPPAGGEGRRLHHFRKK